MHPNGVVLQAASKIIFALAPLPAASLVLLRIRVQDPGRRSIGHQSNADLAIPHVTPREAVAKPLQKEIQLSQLKKRSISIAPYHPCPVWTRTRRRKPILHH